jgi:micrococcal nuclease
VEVIDGDTVKLANGQLLRYLGIDTPEVRIKKGTIFEYDPQPFSLESKEFNRALVENKFVRIEFDVEKYDRYGRILGYCFVGDSFVNARLLAEGYAVLSTRPPNVKYTDVFLQEQLNARGNKMGLWGVYETIGVDEADDFINQIRTVRGRVLDTYNSHKAVFLNFGPDYKTDFTVVIFNDCVRFFRDAGIEPDIFYKGKVVEISGRIKAYNGPEIIVCIPQQIQVVDEK